MLYFLIMSFAVIKTGGKQYKVEVGDKIEVERLEFKPGDEFDFNEVLLIGDDNANIATIGKPMLEGAKVRAKVLEEGKSDKKIVFRYTRKTRYKKKKGHRQPFTKVEILSIAA
ncbi:MAG: large subunit ribosomal protein L21 [Parcubacteria group bacterium Licking1014_17]|nr:MAG: large subunit ribosomal protein L21 [Parcubacteria group bacterium Licking1014_17]